MEVGDTLVLRPPRRKAVTRVDEDLVRELALQRPGGPVRIPMAADSLGSQWLETILPRLKAALVYADVVEFYSPIINEYEVWPGGTVSDLPPDEAPIEDYWPRLEWMVTENAPGHLPDFRAIRAAFDRVRTEAEFEQFKSRFGKKIQRLERKAWIVGEHRERVGDSALLQPAIKSGALVIRELDGGDISVTSEQVLERLSRQALLDVFDPCSYPLFDMTARITLSGRTLWPPEYAFGSSAHAAATGLEFVTMLPNFARGGISEILEAKRALTGPLIRLRGALQQVVDDEEASVSEQRDWLSQTWTRDVAPSIQEIDETVRGDRYLSELCTSAVESKEEMMAGGAGFILGIAAGAPPTLATGVALAASATTLAAKVALKRRVRRKDVSRHRFFFLYQLNQDLGKGR